MLNFAAGIMKEEYSTTTNIGQSRPSNDDFGRMTLSEFVTSAENLIKQDDNWNLMMEYTVDDNVEDVKKRYKIVDYENFYKNYNTEVRLNIEDDIFFL